MGGKHDKGTSGPLATGPIVLRGLSRGVRERFRPDGSARRRAPGGGAADTDVEHASGPTRSTALVRPSISGGAEPVRVRVRRRAPAKRAWLVPGPVLAVVLVVLSASGAGVLAATWTGTRSGASPSSPRATASASDAAALPVVALVGDAAVLGGGSTAGEARLAAGLRAAPARIALVPVADGAYTRRSAGGATLGDAVRRVPVDAAAVVFVSGAADAGSPPLSIAAAATRAFSAVAQRAPGVRIVVVGPLSGEGATPVQLETVRGALRGSARIAGATWVDPIGSGWLGDAAAAASADALTAADERAVADRLRAVVDAALRTSGVAG